MKKFSARASQQDLVLSTKAAQQRPKASWGHRQQRAQAQDASGGAVAGLHWLLWHGAGAAGRAGALQACWLQMLPFTKLPSAEGRSPSCRLEVPCCLAA